MQKKPRLRLMEKHNSKRLYEIYCIIKLIQIIKRATMTNLETRTGELVLVGSQCLKYTTSYITFVLSQDVNKLSQYMGTSLNTV